ncbi:MAG TPA: hypothetical protein VGP90_05055, partial [Acidimicrobiia bacterium]|nr:hypothetical protein [Acidimicrobiia bacterium]
QPVTAAVTRAGLFAAGLMPTVATAAGGSVTYATVLEEWLAAGSKAGAQIDTYVGEGDGTNRLIHEEWKPLFDAVTDYLRVSSNIEQLDRPKAVERIRKNLGASNTTQANQVDWKSLLGPRTAGDYYSKFRDLGDELLAARDTMLLHLRAAHLPGFSHGLFEF